MVWSAQKEAEIILNVLFDEYGSIGVIPHCLPPIQSGKELEEYLEKKQVDYNNSNKIKYYLTLRTQDLLSNQYSEKFRVIHVNESYFLEGDHLWEFQVSSYNILSKKKVVKASENLGNAYTILFDILTDETDFTISKATAYHFNQKALSRSQESSANAFLVEKVFNIEPCEK